MTPISLLTRNASPLPVKGGRTLGRGVVSNMSAANSILGTDKGVEQYPIRRGPLQAGQHERQDVGVGDGLWKSDRAIRGQEFDHRLKPWVLSADEGGGG